MIQPMMTKKAAGGRVTAGRAGGRGWRLAVVGLAVAGVVRAESPVSFARDIRPILSNNCFMCHGPDEAERKGGLAASGGLRLDTEDGSRMELGLGKRAVVPGRPDLSDLMARVTTTDEDDLMPPQKSGKRLSAEEVDLLRRWIAEGGAYAAHWAYDRPVRPPVPRPGMHPVDAFVLERLDQEGLHPQPEADRATLARRVALDLTGLPPTPEQVEMFLGDPAPEAYERYVDRLLDSPAYGEHWARQWLDLARYADSAGYADDPPRTIWAFRDYVIRSFNANLPFDQFTIEQIAGDLLPDPTEDQVIATAFHRNTMTNSEGGTDDEEFRAAAVVDRVNTTLATWMGTSMACAQCHTHKYDPITHHEYFQLYAIFNHTADADRADETPVLSFFTGEQKSQRERIEQALAAVEAKMRQPALEVQAAAARWVGGYPLAVDWHPVVPEAVRSQAGQPVAVAEDGVVAVSGGAAKDTYEITVPISEARSLTALRIDALPDAALAGGGPGHAQGNFVVTGVRVALDPPVGAPRPLARFVRIELPGRRKLLQLAEVEVVSGGENVAVGGVASQKSTFADAVAGRAIDGDREGEYEKGSVAHTGDNTNDPWWEVDLQAEVPVEQIVVWNRVEAAERLEGFRVVALDGHRQLVWERAKNPAARESRFAIDGTRPLAIADAVVDYGQADFDPDAIWRDPAAAPPAGGVPAASARGWAIGGATGRAHAMTLLLSEAVEVPAGATLRVTVEQQSAFDGHTLARFRLAMTGSPEVAKMNGPPPAVAAALAKPAADRDAAEHAQAVAYYYEAVAPELASVREERAALRAERDAMAPSTVPVFRELPADQRRTTHVHLRGNRLTPGDTVTEGVPAAWHPLPEGAPPDRLALARWLVDDANPLTARVVANRHWESIFGVGLVRTSEEFGAQGELPSHPELLDWLATELVRLRWDLKAFLRLLVTSSTYRQSSKVIPGAMEHDPENRLLARGPRVRLTAEMVRDQALAVSGLLSPKMYGPSVRPVRPALGLSAAFGGGLDWQPSEGDDRWRRGIYTEWRRTSPYPSMTTFDAPNREVCTLRRDRTNTPLQALVMMNDPVYVETAQALARRLAAAAAATPDAATPEDVILRGYQWVLARPPTATESSRLRALYDELVAAYRQDAALAEAMATNPIGPLPPGAEAADLAAWTAVASVMLNLDETLMKR